MSDRQPPLRADIDLLIFDFDGVMTDNRVLVFSDGTEAVFCNRADGLGIDMLRDAGLAMVIVSTETSKVVRARAEKLALPVHHGVADKAAAVGAICSDMDVSSERTGFVGNDLNDLGALEYVGWPLCPADAHVRVKEICRWIVPVNGGLGVVRCLADQLLADRSR